MISLTRTPAPDNTQHSQETNIHAPLPNPPGFESTIPTSELPHTAAPDGCGPQDRLVSQAQDLNSM